ncbi:MAG: response regulator [archaeon]|nr:response regulator [archaeon]
MAKILIVDDTGFMQRVITNIIQGMNHEVVGTADNGNDGIRLYKELKPDLVTMDINMPGKTGLDAIQEIMKFDSEAKILLCSALGFEKLKMDAIDMGVKDCITKPFDKEQLVQKIECILKEN